MVEEQEFALANFRGGLRDFGRDLARNQKNAMFIGVNQVSGFYQDSTDIYRTAKIHQMNVSMGNTSAGGKEMEPQRAHFV